MTMPQPLASGDGADRPLVTFALFAYNQERFIREAVEGAFAQTYQPLEIILSDDCSSDRTFEIMEEMAAAYTGPHRVRVRRNAVNVGIGGHVSAVAAAAEGDFIVLAAGDDISSPERVHTLADEWLRSGRNIMAIESGYQDIDADSNALGIIDFTHRPPSMTKENVAEHGGFLVGATTAYDKRVFTRFSPLLDFIHHEDRALLFRALLLGGEVGFSCKPLILYRREVGVSAAYRDARTIDPSVFSRRMLADNLQKLVDAAKLDEFRLEILICNQLRRYSAEVFLLSNGPGIGKLVDAIRYCGLYWALRAFLKSSMWRVRQKLYGSRSS